MAFGKKLVSKGFLGSAISLITKGWLHLTGAEEVPPVWPPKTFCDYPHAVKMATKGRLGATVGTATRGVVLKICIEEFPIEAPRTTGPGMRGFREEEKKKCKKIVITVWAYGKKHVSEHIVEDNVNVSIEDVEVQTMDGNITEVRIRNLKL